VGCSQRCRPPAGLCMRTCLAQQDTRVAS